jgi:two-component system invasion response regulator UvrY
MIRIGIVDPQEIMRKGLATLLGQSGGMQVVGDAASIDDMSALFEGDRLEVLIVDPLVAWGFNLSLIHSLKGQNLNILVFSTITDIEYIQSALRAGALGFVSTKARLSELIHCIEHVARGEPFLCGEVAGKLALCIMNTFSKQPHELLSERELQIMLRLVEGKTIAEVANELHLSGKTVSTHKTRLMQKMNVESFSRLVQYASNHGLIENASGNDDKSA